MQPTIIAIVGASGSGKTYLSKILQSELNIYSIVSFTTRPMREGEVNGQDYYFVGQKPQIPFCNILTETRFSDYDYYALREQVPPTGICTYIVDEGGVENLKRVHSQRFNIITVYVEATEDTLIERGIDLRRIERDKSRKKLPMNEYDIVIGNNDSIEEFEEAIRKTFKNIRQWQHLK